MWGSDGFGIGSGGTGIATIPFWGLIIAGIAVLARRFSARAGFPQVSALEAS